MKITKNMLNEELREMYWPMKFASFLLGKLWFVRWIDKLGARIREAPIEGVKSEEKYIPSRNGGPDIRIRIYKPLHSSEVLPGFLYFHGGGYVMGTPEYYTDIIDKFMTAHPCILIAPDYRKAVKAPYPAAFNDGYDTLLWMKENAQSLGITSDKFIVGGHSAGGGLTAAVVLKARDTQDVKIAFQMPVYPMIDDHQETPSAANSNAPGWDSKSNRLGWNQYLKDLRKENKEIPYYAAPARARNYTGLPPAISVVGDLEPFRDETIAFMEHLKNEGVPVAFKVFTGCFHGFDIVAPQKEISKASWRFLLENYRAFIERYI